MQGIKLTKAIRGVCQVADSPDGARLGLQRVSIRQGWALAADGYFAIRAKLAPDAAEDAEAGSAEPSPRADWLMKAASGLRKGHVAWLRRTEDGYAMENATGDVAATKDDGEGTPPDIMALFDEWTVRPEYAHVTFDANRMADLLKAMVAAGAGKDTKATDPKSVTMVLGGTPQEPIRLYALDADRRPIESVLMPMVLGHNERHGSRTSNVPDGA